MKHIPIGSRCHLFAFDTLGPMITHVTVIDSPRTLFVIDTFLGPDSMKDVMDALGQPARDKPAIVINTHFHWDHIWGNCFFPDARIIAHSTCRTLIRDHSESELVRFARFAAGPVRIVLPNLTFDTRLEFPDEGIELLHTPGHSEDSISIVDHEDRVVIAGDNIEAPIPYLSDPDIRRFAETLNGYRAFAGYRFIAGHADDSDGTLLTANIEYLDALLAGKADRFDRDPFRAIHRANLAVLEGRVPDEPV